MKISYISGPRNIQRGMALVLRQSSSWCRMPRTISYPTDVCRAGKIDVDKKSPDVIRYPDFFRCQTSKTPCRLNMNVNNGLFGGIW